MKYALLAGLVILGFVVVVAALSLSKKTQTDLGKVNSTQTQETKLQEQATPTAQELEKASSSAEAVVTTVTPLPTMTTKQKTYTEPPKLTVDAAKTYTAKLTTSKGEINLELFVKDAPNTVNNFVFLAREGFYNNTPFHRIIKGFMIQGGDPTGTGMGGPGYRFTDEKITREYLRGTIAMANAGPNTNGSQFFIMHADYPLPKNYVIFGKIVEGDEVSFKTLDAIAAVKVVSSSTGEPSKPTEEILINKVTIVEK